MYLYHATDRKNLESIKKNGLLIHPPHHNWEGMYCDDQIFLALNAEAALSYAESAENPPEDIVVLKVKLEDLHQQSFYYDWNNRCEYRTDINSCVYHLDIPGQLLQECNPNDEPDQNIDDFKDTALWEIVLCVFEEQVETNKENYY